MSLLVLNDQNFKKEVLESEIPVLVDFYAEWCPPCKMLAPILEELNKKYGQKIKMAKLNIDKDTEIALQYQVMSVPTLIIFKNGKEIKRIIGLQTKEELENLLDSL